MGEIENGRVPIRVVVVDDYPMVRTGITAMLDTTDDIELVGVAADGEEALRVCAEAHPEVVLMDIQLPHMDGITAIEELHRRDPELQVLVLTTFSDERLVREALQAGAAGYLLKEVDRGTLAEAIRAVRRGRLTLSPTATQALIHAMTMAPESVLAKSDTQLTERELQVLTLVIDGQRNKEIADRLVITPATVKYHIQRLFLKLGVSTRTELVVVAIQRHLIA